MFIKLINIFWGMFDGDKCPNCGSENTIYSNYFKDWHCKSCGYDWE